MSDYVKYIVAAITGCLLVLVVLRLITAAKKK